MKKLTVFLVLALLLVGVTAAWAQGPYPWPTGTMEITPEAVPNQFIGHAGHYCYQELDYNFGMKISAWGGKNGKDGSYDGAYVELGKMREDFTNTITLANTSRLFFDWASNPFAIGAVVVQGGPMDNIFSYEPPASNDTTLYPDIVEKTKKNQQISHISFCWNKTDDNGDDECYADETAWAAGEPYGDQGNWAMYVPYDGKKLEVDLIAGQNMIAGTVTFSDPVDGKVTITITLNEGWIFYYDLDPEADPVEDEKDNNLKVQDYAEAPSGNPAPGLFDSKTFIEYGEVEGSIVVPENNFYGVHLDLAQLVDCE